MKVIVGMLQGILSITIHRRSVAWLVGPSTKQARKESIEIRKAIGLLRVPSAGK